jgi:Exopolysaccharide biosynthesis protein
MNDFVKMVKNLKWCMEQKIVRAEGEYKYPTGVFGTEGRGIKINFVHYKSFEEGVQKWEEGKKRINWDNLFIVGTARGDFWNYDTIKNFNQLPYKNKVIFINVDYPEFQAAYYIKSFEKERQLGVLIDYKSNPF